MASAPFPTPALLNPASGGKVDFGLTHKTEPPIAWPQKKGLLITHNTIDLFDNLGIVPYTSTYIYIHIGEKGGKGFIHIFPRDTFAVKPISHLSGNLYNHAVFQRESMGD
jgi:hypothetical protein